MYEIDPADVTQCGSRIHEVAVGWGQEADRLRQAARDGTWGSGRVSAALQVMWAELEPPARDYLDQTGLCLAEVSVAVHSMADAYRRTEQTNTDQSDRILGVLRQLGPV